jgi:hypothetical protein
MNEVGARTEHINPCLKGAGCCTVESTCIRREDLIPSPRRIPSPDGGARAIMRIAARSKDTVDGSRKNRNPS